MAAEIPVIPDSEYNDRLRTHDKFYIPTGDIEFQVNLAIFKVHKHFLIKHSVVLRDMFDTPQPLEGDSPIKLSGDTIRGWESILSLFYSDDPFTLPTFSAEQWAAMLRISHKYMMDIIEKKAKNGLLYVRPPLDMVELLLLSREVNADELYELACKNLAKEELVSHETARKIGLDALYKIVSLKNAASRSPGCSNCPTTIGIAHICNGCTRQELVCSSCRASRGTTPYCAGCRPFCAHGTPRSGYCVVSGCHRRLSPYG